ncbi:hypothetical protein [Streptomyces sp. Ac-502]|uniref:hypothetical protein n=1 Tax=Streptomyces sp. Ac-502 TaxID=3342801 RepID=UPI0038628131
MPTTPAVDRTDRTRLIFYAACFITQARSQLDKNPPPAIRTQLLAALERARAIIEATCPEAAALLRRSQ